MFFNQQKIQRRVLVQMPIFLSALGNCLGAGYSLNGAFEFLENEIPDPLGAEIKKINQIWKLQGSFSGALKSFSKKFPHPDINLFVFSTLLQYKSGGNLVPVCEKINKLIESRQKLQRDIQSFTAQGKFSAVLIAGLWPISFLFFYFFSPMHINILLETPLGHFLLFLSLFFECLGFFFIWKIITIKL